MQEAPLLALHLPKPCTETLYSARTTNCHLRYKGERNGVQRRTNVALEKPRCKHWSCCGWQKGMSPDEVMLNSEEIKAVAIVVIELHLSEGISKGVSESVSQ